MYSCGYICNINHDLKGKYLCVRVGTFVPVRIKDLFVEGQRFRMRKRHIDIMTNYF